MGGYDSQKNSSFQQSSSYTTTKESALSKEQLKILQNREEQYNNYFFPELQKAIASTDPDSSESASKLALQSEQINSAFQSAQKQTNQSLAQQGLLGDKSGVAASLTAKNNRARASALAQSYYNTMTDNASQKATLLGIGASLMPTPTTSAQYHQTSQTNSSMKSDGSSWGVKVG